MFGASPVAEAGQVLFIVAGPSAGREAISPYLKGVMGRGVIDLGDDVAKSGLMKTSGYVSRSKGKMNMLTGLKQFHNSSNDGDNL